METIKQTIERKTDEGTTNIIIWEWLQTIITKLGPKGTSSDESNIDGKTGTEVLSVNSLIWCRSCKKAMDLIDKQRRADKELFSNKGGKSTLHLQKYCYSNTRQNAPTGKPKAILLNSR